MNIVIIGTGNTATVLGRRLRDAGHTIIQVFGRDPAAASALAYELDAESTNYWSVVHRSADLYLIAVSDIAVAEVAAELQLPQGTVVHTAASVPLEVLEHQPHRGVFYPLQTLKKEMRHQPDIPLLIDAGDQPTLEQLRSLASSISGQVLQANDLQRQKLHLAAVFCNNFVNHLYALTAAYCHDEGIDFSLLQPLIQETAARLLSMPPAEAQTGPAIRKDETTMERHRQLLAQYPEMLEWYNRFSAGIQKQKQGTDRQ